MKALVLRGKRKGKIVEINQFCNDWFSDVGGNIYSPLSLAFTPEDMDIIIKSNCGMMLAWFQITEASTMGNRYIFTFKRKKFGVEVNKYY